MANFTEVWAAFCLPSLSRSVALYSIVCTCRNTLINHANRSLKNQSVRKPIGPRWSEIRHASFPTHLFGKCGKEKSRYDFSLPSSTQKCGVEKTKMSEGILHDRSLHSVYFRTPCTINGRCCKLARLRPNLGVGLSLFLKGVR